MFKIYFILNPFNFYAKNDNIKLKSIDLTFFYNKILNKSVVDRVVFDRTI